MRMSKVMIAVIVRLGSASLADAGTTASRIWGYVSSICVTSSMTHFKPPALLYC
jgi:hypothetical protein